MVAMLLVTTPYGLYVQNVGEDGKTELLFVLFSGNCNCLYCGGMQQVFRALLHFIYKDVLPDTKELSGLSTSTLLAQHLLAAADQYGLDRLRLLCESKLCENVSTDTVATTLALAEQHHASELKAVCLKFAASNLAAVMQSEGFEYLQKSCPTLQSELLKTVAGVHEDGGEGGGGTGSVRNRSVWGQSSDGTDANGRRVRPRT
jgi:speckle-type POZ protein